MRTSNILKPMSFASRTVRFGAFEFDLQNRDLRKSGHRVKLQKQPFQILALLLESPGDLVTRDRLAQHLWPGLHVNFDHSLNTAVSALRRALGDSSRDCRFIETRQGVGYRFIAGIEPLPLAAELGEEADASNGQNGLDEAVDSIAALPFECIGSAPGVGYLADGIAESIISYLSAIEHVRVIARSTAFCYRGPGVEPRKVGEILKVRAVCSGRLELRGDEVTITAEVVDVKTGAQLWAVRHACMRAEVPAMEQEISTAIFERLGSPAKSRGSRVVKPYTGNFEAYRNYLKGRYFNVKMTAEDLHKGVAYFEAALADDPSYALAYAGLADTYCLFAVMNIIPSREAHTRARGYATAASRIDQDLAEVQASLGTLKWLFEWDWAGSEEGFRRALELNPNYASGHRLYASYLSSMGKHDEALRAMRLAQELDPLSLVVDMELAWQLYLARDFQAAMEQSWKTLAMEPHFAPAQNTLGLAYQAMGTHEEAILEFQNAVNCSGSHPASIASLAHAYAKGGDVCRAKAALRELQLKARQRYVSPYWLALVHTGLGQQDLAFECLHKAHAERDVWLVWLKVEPRFDCLRRDPRFVELLRMIRLSPSQSKPLVQASVCGASSADHFGLSS
jgi:TolB-like protein/tetratricopeptide (TPR) repeat protein